MEGSAYPDLENNPIPIILDHQVLSLNLQVELLYMA